MNILQMILEILAVATGAAQVANGASVNDPDVAVGVTLATALESIATKAVTAYEAQTGTPLDLTKLHAETPVPMPDSGALTSEDSV
jgi:hypothetical protein